MDLELTNGRFHFKMKPKRFESVSPIWKPKILLPGGESSGGVLI